MRGTRKLAGRAVALCLLAMIVLAAAPGRPAAQGKPTEWNAYTYIPAATLAPARGLQRIADAMDKASKGSLKIKIHLGGSLPVGATDISNALSDNVIQFGDDGFFQGNLPVTGILRLPMLIATPEEQQKAIAVMAPYFERAYRDRGMVLLGHYSFPLQTVWSRKPVKSLADIKGQKLRVTSAEQGEFVKRLGGFAVTIGASEVPSALDRGVVDGVFTASSGGGKIWKDLLSANYRVGPNFFDGVLAVNKAAFDKLTPALQAQLRKVSAETAAWITAELAKEEATVTADLAKGGITVTPAVPVDIYSTARLMTSYWDEWAKAKGPESVEALAKVRAALGR